MITLTNTSIYSIPGLKRDLMPPSVDQYEVAQKIISNVSYYSGYPKSKLLSFVREDNDVAFARHLLRYVIFHHTQFTKKEVGMIAGRVDHSTALTSINIITGYRDSKHESKEKAFIEKFIRSYGYTKVRREQNYSKRKQKEATNGK